MPTVLGPDDLDDFSPRLAQNARNDGSTLLLQQCCVAHEHSHADDVGDGVTTLLAFTDTAGLRDGSDDGFASGDGCTDDDADGAEPSLGVRVGVTDGLGVTEGDCASATSNDKSNRKSLLFAAH
jgi:hypothetical protein